MSWVGVVLLVGPPIHLNKMHQYYCSYDLVKEQILRYRPQDYFYKLSCSQINAVDPWRILHGYNAADRDADLGHINDEYQYLFYIQYRYQVLNHNTIGATFFLYHLKTSYITVHIISAHRSIQLAFKDKPFIKIVQDPEEGLGCRDLTNFLTKLNNSYKSSFFAVFC